MSNGPSASRFDRELSLAGAWGPNGLGCTPRPVVDIRPFFSRGATLVGGVSSMPIPATPRSSPSSSSSALNKARRTKPSRARKPSIPKRPASKRIADDSSVVQSASKRSDVEIVGLCPNPACGWELTLGDSSDDDEDEDAIVDDDVRPVPCGADYDSEDIPVMNIDDIVGFHAADANGVIFDDTDLEATQPWPEA
jgi:hypothetical protein